jgi:hypothetical protein
MTRRLFPHVLPLMSGAVALPLGQSVTPPFLLDHPVA